MQGTTYRAEVKMSLLKIEILIMQQQSFCVIQMHHKYFNVEVSKGGADLN